MSYDSEEFINDLKKIYNNALDKSSNVLNKYWKNGNGSRNKKKQQFEKFEKEIEKKISYLTDKKFDYSDLFKIKDTFESDDESESDEIVKKSIKLKKKPNKKKEIIIEEEQLKKTDMAENGMSLGKIIAIIIAVIILLVILIVLSNQSTGENGSSGKNGSSGGNGGGSSGSSGGQ